MARTKWKFLDESLSQSRNWWWGRGLVLWTHVHRLETPHSGDNQNPTLSHPTLGPTLRTYHLIPWFRYDYTVKRIWHTEGRGFCKGPVESPIPRVREGALGSVLPGPCLRGTYEVKGRGDPSRLSKVKRLVRNVTTYSTPGFTAPRPLFLVESVKVYSEGEERIVHDFRRVCLYGAWGYWFLYWCSPTSRVLILDRSARRGPAPQAKGGSYESVAAKLRHRLRRRDPSSPWSPARRGRATGV